MPARLPAERMGAAAEALSSVLPLSFAARDNKDSKDRDRDKERDRDRERERGKGGRIRTRLAERARDGVSRALESGSLAWSNGRLGKAIAGHRQLIRLHLEA